MDVNLRTQVGKFPHWHHSIDLGDGFVTPGGKSLATCNSEANVIFNRVDLTSRSVIDVGAWNGFFSFEAKRRGAARVLATDSYCWTHPHFRGRETFDLARSALGIQVDAREIDVAQLSPETVGEFDIVLFLGVFYHRYDAIEALEKVARLAKHVLIVETQLDLRHIKRPAMAFYPGSELGGDDTNWWGPNEQCMRALLLGHGFAEVEVSAHPVFRYGRAIFHAWRSTETRRSPLSRAARLKPTNFVLNSKIVRAATRPIRRLFGL
jgi:tRNA (mo5U34)-methyltransferase